MLETCEKCNGRGILLETLKPHNYNNPHCSNKTLCPHFLINICPECRGHGTFFWIDNIFRRFPLKTTLKESSRIEIEKIIKKKILLTRLSSDISDSYYLQV